MTHSSVLTCLYFLFVAETAAWWPFSQKDSVNCYAKLGCFEAGKGSFAHQKYAPQSPEIVSPEFIFYAADATRRDDSQPFRFSETEEKILKLKTDASKELFVIVHGFGKAWPKPWMFDIHKALNDKDYNTLLVKWTSGSSEDHGYAQVAANSRIVGAMVASVLKSMAEHKKTTFKKVNCVGFGLGGHVCGFAGKLLQQPEKMSRIFGLDPSGDLFEGVNPQARLDKEDAGYVVGIHTNAFRKENHFGPEGIGQSFGHVDFYANGGTEQPGCVKHSLVGDTAAAISYYNPFTKNDYTPKCSHQRAAEIFIEAIVKADKQQPPKQGRKRREVLKTQDQGPASESGVSDDGTPIVEDPSVTNDPALTQKTDSNQESCSFIAFPCLDPLNKESHKKCFPCDAEGVCRKVGLNQAQDGVTGEYSFFTRNGGAKKQLCGLPYGMELVPDRPGVRGAISVHVSFCDYSSEKYQFLQDGEVLATTGHHKMYVGPWSKPIKRLKLHYTRHTNTLKHNEGVPEWNIKEFWLIGHDAKVILHIDTENRKVVSTPTSDSSTDIPLKCLYMDEKGAQPCKPCGDS